MTDSPTLLITGGGGSVGTQIRPWLRQAGYRLRIFSNSPVDAAEDEQVVIGDVRDRAAVERALAGCDAMLHLAGCTTDADWPDQIAGNIEGCVAAFEAARAQGIARVIYGSSNHVVGMYPRTREVGIADLLRPDSRYGVTKAFGELLGAFFADKYGLRVLCIRIGNVAPLPVDRRRLSLWISPRDMAQLVVRGIEDPALHFRIVYGVSDDAPRFFAPGSGDAIGYIPQDRSQDHFAAVQAADPPNPETAAQPGELLQGGNFAASEFAGDLQRMLAAFAQDAAPG